MLLAPKKRFGQNFLQDGHVLSRIVDIIGLQPGDHVVEIGPGRGALTLRLLAKAAKVDAIEIDRDLVRLLQDYKAQFPNFVLHNADALEFDFSSLYSDALFRVVGNLPYNISTPLLFHLIKFCAQIKDMHFMLQKEVAERIFAQPKTKQYGRLSVMVQYHLKGEILFKVSKNSFYPAPKVSSAFIKLIPLKKPLQVADYVFFGDLVKTAFSMRRKTLHNALKKFLEVDKLALLGDYAKCRAEELGVADFVLLCNRICKF